jgi:hypothetical protein
MAHLQYFNYPGVGEDNNKNFAYSQAVRVGDHIHCSGQGKSYHLIIMGQSDRRTSVPIGAV